MAGGEEFGEAEVPEDLELLADFVADVGVDRKTRNWKAETRKRNGTGDGVWPGRRRERKRGRE